MGITRRRALGALGSIGALTALAGVPTIVMAASPREKLTVAVGSEHAMVYLPWDVAKALGYFEQEGLDIDINYTKGGSEAAQALVSGSVDYSGNAIDHAIAASERGKSLVMISDFMNEPGVTLVVRPQDKGKFKTFADLKGKTLGITSPGSATHVLGVWMAKRAGVNRDDMKFIGVGGGSTMPAALSAGQVDAAIGNDPFVTQLIRAGRAAAFIELFTPATVRANTGFSNYCFTGALTRSDVIAKSPERTQKIVNALVRAQKYMATHTSAQLAGVLPDEFRAGLGKEDWAAGYSHSRPAYTQNGEIALEGVRAVIETNNFFLGQESKVDPAKLFDNTFVDKAKKSVRV
ncbi:MAG: ABC transporter substrate-binding protein [Candidatus Velthaea sp.]